VAYFASHEGLSASLGLPLREEAVIILQLCANLKKKWFSLYAFKPVYWSKS
tara:strand:- start:2381 stop:2533 length:153 start_codon:yes stop_codon:yes gene_type:complete